MDVPAGWHQDPGGPAGQLRWWDGRRWTEHVTAPPPAHPTPTTADSTPASWPVAGGVVVAIVALCTVIALGALVAVAGGDTARSADEPGPVEVAPADEETAEEETAEAAAQPSEKAKPDRASRPSRTPKPTKSTSESPTTSPQVRTYLVTRVVDGDTIGLGNGETVRLVGIDTPETGDCGSLKATGHLSDLVLWKRVRLTVSDEDRDGYGRLLRYVDVGSVDAGLSLIRAGLAIARYDSRDGYGFHAREPRYVAADAASPPVRCAQPQPLAGVGDGCASGYSPCIPAYPPDLDCADVNGPLVVTGADPHGLDADGDGSACE